MKAEKLQKSMSNLAEKVRLLAIFYVLPFIFSISGSASIHLLLPES